MGIKQDLATLKTLASQGSELLLLRLRVLQMDANEQLRGVLMIVALIVSDLHLARFYSSLLSALIFIVLFMIVVAEVLKQIYPPKS